MNNPGPDPYKVNKVWADSATEVEPFPGGANGVGKQKQADAIDINAYKDVNLILIGYSAGGDSALIFADKYRKYPQENNGIGKITDIAVLGGTMTGNMTDSGTLLETWPVVLDNLLLWGTDIYILRDDANFGDKASVYSAPVGASGTFFYDDRPNQSHTTFTNNSESYKNEVYNWFSAH